MIDLVKCNYTLLDCGNFEKLEQVGEVIIRRPAPKAAWRQKFDLDKWQHYHAKFDPLQNKWITYPNEKLPYFEFKDFTFELRLSPNGQIGIFPEQLTNWLWLTDIVNKTSRPLNILNGFAYTGASTLITSTAETNITHIDASSSSVNWAKHNCQLSGLKNNNIRWIIDDIISFLSREVRRGSVYDGIILDPPAFGHGKKGTTWKIGRDLPKLMKLVDKLLSNDPEFIILSCHDKDFGHRELRNELTKLHDLKNGKIETFDLTIKSESGNNLPAGKCVRWKKLN